VDSREELLRKFSRSQSRIEIGRRFSDRKRFEQTRGKENVGPEEKPRGKRITLQSMTCLVCRPPSNLWDHLSRGRLTTLKKTSSALRKKNSSPADS